MNNIVFTQGAATVCERILSDSSKVYDVYFRSEGTVRFFAAAVDLGSAILSAALVADAMARAYGVSIPENGTERRSLHERHAYACPLCGQRIDDGKPCGCGAR